MLNVSIILDHFFEDTMYAYDLLEGTVEKDWTDIDPFKIAKPPKWCSKIWFLLHIRQVLIITYICHIHN